MNIFWVFILSWLGVAGLTALLFRAYLVWESNHINHIFRDRKRKQEQIANSYHAMDVIEKFTWEWLFAGPVFFFPLLILWAMAWWLSRRGANAQ